MIITLKDGSVKEYESPKSVYELHRISAKVWQEWQPPGKSMERA